MDAYFFVAICPNGHLANQEGFARSKLQRSLLANETLRLYCLGCDTSWNAGPDLIESLKRSLAER